MPRGFTLLEVILALGLAVVILGLVGLGINVHLAVATKSREQVEEVQLADPLATDCRRSPQCRPVPAAAFVVIVFRLLGSVGAVRLAGRFRLDGLVRHIHWGDVAGAAAASGAAFAQLCAVCAARVEAAARLRATLAQQQHRAEFAAAAALVPAPPRATATAASASAATPPLPPLPPRRCG